MKRPISRLIFLLLAIPASGNAFAVPAPADTLKVWTVAAHGIAIDPLGNLYILEGNSLTKFDPAGDSVCSWSDPKTGRVTLADAGDPLRIMVYQRDFNLVRFLNNRLAPLADPIALDDLGLTTPLTLGVCRQGGFWVLDGNSTRLRLIGPRLTTVVESIPLNLPSTQVTAGYRLFESGDHVYLLIPDREILVFDLFANLIRKIPLRMQAFGVYGNRILLVRPESVSLWNNPVTDEEMIWTDDSADLREACLFQNRLFFRTSRQAVLISR